MIIAFSETPFEYQCHYTSISRPQNIEKLLIEKKVKKAQHRQPGRTSEAVNILVKETRLVQLISNTSNNHLLSQWVLLT
jgi:hypothetical protein